MVLNYLVIYKMAVITTKTAKSEIIYAYNNSRLYACCMQFKMV